MEKNTFADIDADRVRIFNMSLLTKGLPTVNNSPVVGRDGTDDDVSSTVGNPGSPQISGRKKKNDTSDKPKKKNLGMLSLLRHLDLKK